MKTANWFLLEDEQYRIDFFRERGVPAANVFLWPEQLVSAVEQADRPIVVFLDHDLGLRLYEPYPREVTGADAAEGLAKLGRPGVYIVHSLNDAGARRMVGHLLEIKGAMVARVPMNAMFSRDVAAMVDGLMAEVSP